MTTDFPALSEHAAVAIERSYRVGQPRPENAPISNSERDWAEINRALAMGRNPEELVRELAAKRTDKPNPQYYASLTVSKALKEQVNRRALRQNTGYSY